MRVKDRRGGSRQWMLLWMMHACMHVPLWNQVVEMWSYT